MPRGLSLWLIAAGTVVCICVQLQGESLAKPRAAAVSAAEPDPARPSVAARRIVKHFDFDEQPLGNFEAIPMFWRRHGEAGFPLYLEGRFDRRVGHAAAPSFRLDLDGGSLAYHYQGRDISVRANSDYLVVAWVKTAHLRKARAYVTAYYLDRKGNKVAGSERSSIQIDSQNGDWQPVTLGLPAGTALSRYIGLSLWLVQPDASHDAPASQPVHAINREDVKGTAWFDDITVYRLPRVALWSTHPGNIFQEDEAVELRAEVTDPDGLNIKAGFVLRDVNGRSVDSQPVAILSDGSEAQRLTYDELPAGLYHAELIVSAGDAVLVKRTVPFVRVSRPISPPQAFGRGFGVILSDVTPGAYSGQRQVLEYLRAGAVKLPVWSPLLSSQPSSQYSVLDQYLESIVSTGGEPVGIMTALGRAAPDQEEPQRGLLDIFSGPASGWKPRIAGTWSRYAGLVHTWQLGNDGEIAAGENPRLAAALSTLRREMAPLMSRPRLATSGLVHEPANGALDSDYHCMVVPPQLPAADIAAHLQLRAAPNRAGRWAVVQPLSARGYPRESRLADLALRLAEAHFAGVGTVFMAAPWHAEAELLSSRLVPHEDLIVFRTVADLLGGSTPVARSVLNGCIACTSFERDGRAILLVQDPQAPPQGREHVLYLGEGAECVDLFGRRTRLASVGRQQVLRVGPSPCFVINTPIWITEFHRQFLLDPPSLQASLDEHHRGVTFRNTTRQPISGMLRLIAPPDWDVRPNRLPFALQPGEEFRQPITLRFPLNAEAGVTPLVGEFDIDAGERYRLVATAWFELGIEGIDVEAYTFRAGDRVVVRQLLTNRTGETLNFDGYLLAPRRQRIDRAFWNFQPGQSMIKNFVLEDAAELAGHKLRIGLKEVQGTRVWNQLITVP